MNKIFLTLSASLFLFLTAACGEVSCDNVECGAGEYCVLYGSDVATERSTTGCTAFPEECSETETCACLDENTGEDETNRFCINFGCEEDEQVSIVCPGG